MLDSYDIVKYIAGCANNAGVTVKWDKEGSVPCTDGKTMFLPLLNDYMSDEAIVKLKQFVKHETSHIKYSDFDLLKEKEPEKFLQTVWNLLEDHRIDYLNDTEFEGDMLNTNQFMRYHIASTIKEVTSPINPQVAGVLSPLFTWDANVRRDEWDMEEAEGFYLSTCSEDGKSILVKLMEGDYSDVLRNIRNIEDKKTGTAATYELAKRIIKEVFEQDADSMEKSGGSSAESKPGEGEEGGAPADGDAKAGEKDVTPELKEVDFSGAKMNPYPEHGKRGSGINAKNYDCGCDKTYTPTPPDQIRVHDYDSNITKPTPWFDKSAGRYTSTEAIARHLNNTGFANRIRTRLQVYSRDRWEFGKKKGKLHNSSLYRISVPDCNDKVFKKKIENQTLDVCVQLLVDASGSMCGEKFENAAAAACLLNESLARTLHIPVEILAFTELGPEHTIFVLKNFDSKVGGKELADRFSRTSGYLCDNVDGESLSFGFNRIRNRKEKRKLMIVLSDGSPCGGHRKGRTRIHTKDVINAIQRTPVELIGVGIMYDGVSSYYKKWDIIHDVRSIENSLFTLIDRNIIR